MWSHKAGDWLSLVDWAFFHRAEQGDADISEVRWGDINTHTQTHTHVCCKGKVIPGQAETCRRWGPGGAWKVVAACLWPQRLSQGLTK